MSKELSHTLFFRDLNDDMRREIIHSWNVEGRLDLIHAVNNDIDVLVGATYINSKDCEVL